METATNSTSTTPVVGGTGTLSNETPQPESLRTPIVMTSRDNVASALRKKAHASREDVSGTPTSMGAPPPPKFKTPLRPQSDAGPLSCKKASNIHGFKASEVTIKRTLSAQNIASSNGVPSPGVLNGSNLARSISIVKRTASSQNVSGGRAATRVSAPTGGAMACNAELLANFEKEKKALDRRISELIQVTEMRKTEIEKLKYENKNLRELIPSVEAHEELELLRAENKLLRERLSELNVSVEHFTDTEKLQLLQHRSNASREDDGESAAAAIRPVRCASDVDSRGGDLDFDLPGGGVTRGGVELAYSLDCQWDKASNKSSEGGMSEVSVACLQDRILQMEETHYSTNEELQATLQELTDLQDAVNELSSENDRLADEKYVLLESLCAQTEKLENARLQIEHLKALVLRDFESGERTDNERQLVALLHGAEEEREELLLKQTELNNAVQVACMNRQELQDVVTALRDKLQLQGEQTEGLIASKREVEDLLAVLQGHAVRSGTTDLEDVKTNNDEGAAACNNNDDQTATRKDSSGDVNPPGRVRGDYSPEDVTAQQEVTSRLRNHLEEVKHELMTLRAQSKSRVADLEHRLKMVESERVELRGELEAMTQRVDELQASCEQYEEERTTQTHVVARLESELRTNRQRMSSMESELKESSQRHNSEVSEWRQFHDDLKIAVVIANEFKTEAEVKMDEIKDSNQSLQEQLNAALVDLNLSRGEIDRLKQAQQRAMAPPPLVNRDDIRGKVISTVDRELAVRRQGRDLKVNGGNNSSLSVRHLISSIEEQVKNEGVPCSPAQSFSTTPALNVDSTDSIVVTTNSGGSSNGSLVSPSTSAQLTGFLPETKRLTRPSYSTSDVAKVSPTRASLPPTHRYSITDMHVDSSSAVSDDTKQAAALITATAAAAAPTEGGVSASNGGGSAENIGENGKKPLTGILTNKSTGPRRRTSVGIGSEDKSPDKPSTSFAGGPYPGAHLGKTDPLALLSKQLGGSKRNSLLKWCQNKTATYNGIDITNFSSSWNDGLAFCALLHTYLPDKIAYNDLNAQEKSKNFALAFKAAESVNIMSSLDVKEMIATERPDWQAVMSYVTSIYKHFEVDTRHAIN